MLSAEAVLLNTFDECGISEKAMDLSLRVHGHGQIYMDMQRMICLCQLTR